MGENDERKAALMAELRKAIENVDAKVADAAAETKRQLAQVEELKAELLALRDPPDFASAARPLIKWMNSVHPHHTAIVTAIDAELVEGVQMFRTEEYLRDKAPAPVAAPSLADLDWLAAELFALFGDPNKWDAAGRVHDLACWAAGVDPADHFKDWYDNRRESAGGE